MTHGFTPLHMLGVKELRRCALPALEAMGGWGAAGNALAAPKAGEAGEVLVTASIEPKEGAKIVVKVPPALSLGCKPIIVRAVFFVFADPVSCLLCRKSLSALEYCLMDLHGTIAAAL